MLIKKNCTHSIYKSQAEKKGRNFAETLSIKCILWNNWVICTFINDGYFINETWKIILSFMEAISSRGGSVERRGVNTTNTLGVSPGSSVDVYEYVYAKDDKVY